MKARFHFKKISTGKFDAYLFIFTMVLMFFGLLMVYDSSSVISSNIFGDNYIILKIKLSGLLLVFLLIRFLPH